MPVPSMALNRLNFIYYISIKQLVLSTILDQLKKNNKIGEKKDKSISFPKPSSKFDIFSTSFARKRAQDTVLFFSNSVLKRTQQRTYMDTGTNEDIRPDVAASALSLPGTKQLQSLWTCSQMKMDF